MLYWILLLFHSPNFWIWFVAPCSIFFLERIYRIAKTFSEKGKTETKLGLILASKVVHLVIKRPRNFKFKAGDYIFVNIPAITKYQWHPFTISSAPEQNDIRWKHIHPEQCKAGQKLTRTNSVQYVCHFISSSAALLLILKLCSKLLISECKIWMQWHLIQSLPSRSECKIIWYQG